MLQTSPDLSVDFPGYTRVCLCVFVNLDTRLEKIWLRRALLDIRKQYGFDPDHQFEA